MAHPIETLDDVLTVTRTAKHGLTAHLTTLRAGAPPTVRLDPVAASMLRSIPAKTRLEQPAVAKRLHKLADLYRRPFTLEEAETLLHETNAQLDAFYNLYPTVRRQALRSNPRIAVLDAQARALRQTVYGALDQPGQGAAARELNRRYGALLEVEETALRRRNVAMRQQPESLSEQIGTVRAAADLARGTWRIAHGDLTGTADVAAAHAGRATAKALKEGQTSNALIRRAFQQVRQAPTPIPMPAPPSIRGLLPAGPRLMGPGEGESAVRGIAARRMVQRDPRTGQMRRIYLGEEP